jgi:hypothetical protein
MYKGTVTTVKKPGIGYICIDSVRKSDGSPHGIMTSEPISIYVRKVGISLVESMTLSFDVISDGRRSDWCFTATNVSVVAHAHALIGNDGKEVADPRSLYVPPTVSQLSVKKVDPEMVGKVIGNNPFPLMRRDVPRQDSSIETTERLMKTVFPTFVEMDLGGVSDVASVEFCKAIRDSITEHRELGMHEQADKMMASADTYIGLKKIYHTMDNALQSEAIIPIAYLPELFMAVPVWYFWADISTQKIIVGNRAGSDPIVSLQGKYMCDLIPNKHWVDTYLMFNCRTRTLADYSGDIIPPAITKRIKEMSGLFDHLVIMTPYHDVAGADWEDLEWQRMIDPYVIGFVTGVPFMFMIGRFSDSGVFPLHSEMVADTISFLKQNRLKLHGFNSSVYLIGMHQVKIGTTTR